MNDFTVIDSKKLAKLKKLNLEKINLDKLESSFGLKNEEEIRYYKIQNKITKLINKL
jgi:ribonuclease HII